ncbi:uncharacterized protein LOC141899621 [Tubulanus polymorphus]|uniref:uncharacterized protein LOC141899621 n=1 Tax=Tubulanus polymorphus TaxID=672921 RepID=UPI003DA4F91F
MADVLVLSSDEELERSSNNAKANFRGNALKLPNFDCSFNESVDEKSKPMPVVKELSSDSNTDSPPTKKKPSRTVRNISRKTIRGKINNNKSLNSAVETSAKSCVYTNKVNQCFTSFQNKGLNLIAKETAASSDEEGISNSNVRLRARTNRVTRSSSEKENSPSETLRDTGCYSPDSSTLYVDDRTPNRSPSPPPPPPTPPPNIAQPERKKRQKKDVKDALRSLDHVKVLSNISSINTQETGIDDSFSDVTLLSPVAQKAIIIKVRSRSGIHRICMTQDEPFHRVIVEMAAKEGLPSDRCMLLVRDATIRPYDTPAKHNLTVADILSFTVQCDDQPLAEEICSGGIKIFLQTKGYKTKLSASLMKDEPLQKAMLKYSVERTVDLKKLKFFFDGEEILPTQTPNDVDLDEDDVIDVVHL